MNFGDCQDLANANIAELDRVANALVIERAARDARDEMRTAVRPRRRTLFGFGWATR